MKTIADIGAAVIGTGFIGTVHVEALRRIGVQVRGVLGSSPERGQARAESLGVKRAYASLDALLADDAVDVVHVTSPNDLHVSQSREILAAGKHVVCEKPLALTATESAELVRLAAPSGLVNATNFNIRYYPLNQHAHELIADGGLGEVRLVTGRYFQDWLLLESDWNWRLQPDRGGALRAVGDIGSHWLDLMTFVTGQHVTEVMADLSTFIGTRHEPTGPVETFSTARSAESLEREISTEDTASILLRFEGGARGAVSISQISPGRKNSLVYEIDGSDGAWGWDSEQPDQAWAGHRDRPNEVLIRNPALMGPAGQAASSLPAGHVEGFFDTFCAHFRTVYADVVAGAPSSCPSYPTFADGHDEMLVGDAIARSAREGRWIEVDRTGTTATPDPVTPEPVR
jgi:predicted dehydrogenase